MSSPNLPDSSTQISDAPLRDPSLDIWQTPVRELQVGLEHKNFREFPDALEKGIIEYIMKSYPAIVKWKVGVIISGSADQDERDIQLMWETRAKSWIDENNESIGYQSIHYRVFKGAFQSYLMLTITPDSLNSSGKFDYKIGSARLTPEAASRLLSLMKTLNGGIIDNSESIAEYGNEIALFTAMVESLSDMKYQIGHTSAMRADIVLNYLEV